MRDYGKLYSTFWTSDTTRELSDSGKLLALYLLLGPHTNMIGCYRLPDGYIMDDLGWSKETVSKGFEELFRNGFATRDNGSKWVLVHQFLKWNPIENPNQGKAAGKLFESVPNTFAAKSELAHRLEVFGDRIPKEAIERFRNGSRTVSKPGTGTGAVISTQDLNKTADELDDIELYELNFRKTPDGFREFWSEYPNKTKLFKAIEAWKILDPTPAMRTRVMAGLKVWKTSQQWADRCLELAANWLNAHMFNEKPEPVKNAAVRKTGRQEPTLPTPEEIRRKAAEHLRHNKDIQ